MQAPCEQLLLAQQRTPMVPQATHMLLAQVAPGPEQ